MNAHESARLRDAHTEQLIADARSNVETPLEGPFDDKPALDLGPLPTLEQMADQMPRTVLTGDSHDAYSEFCAAAKALADNQRAAAVVLERYKAALQRLSEAAAKVG